MSSHGGLAQVGGQPSWKMQKEDITPACDPKQLRRDHIQRDKTGTFRGAMGGEGGNGTEKRP